MNRILVFTFLLLLNLPAFAGDLKIIPQKPAENSSITLNYAPGNFFGKGDHVSAFIYGFQATSAFPQVYEVNMSYSRSSDSYTGSFAIPAGIVYGLVKVGNEEKFDDNANNFWDFIVYGSDGNPVPGGYLKSGMSYLGSYPENYNRNVNFASALDYFQKENQLYPNDLTGKIALLSLQFDLKKISKDDFENRLSDITKQDITINDENVLTSFTRALRTNKQNDRADQMESKFAESHPKSKVAEERRFAALSKIRKFKDFSNAVVEFIKDFPNSSYREKVYNGLIAGYIQKKEFNEVKNLLDSLPNVPASAYIGLAKAIQKNKNSDLPIDDNVRMVETRNLFNKAVAETYEKDYDLKPSYLTNFEWDRLRITERAATFENIGDIYKDLSSADSSYKYYMSSIEIWGDKTPSQLYEKVIDIVDSKQDNAGVLALTEKAIINSAVSPDILGENKSKYVKLKGNDTGYDNYLDSLRNLAKEKRQQKIKSEMLDAPAELSNIETLEGLSVDARIFKGSIVIIGFWSSWCEPCGKLLAAMDSLHDVYSNRQDIVFLPVDVWENVVNKKQEARNYIKNSDIEMPVYIDTKEQLPQKLGVVGLPTTVFIDKSGKIRFVVSGFDDEEKIIRDIQDRIDLLSSGMSN